MKIFEKILSLENTSSLDRLKFSEHLRKFLLDLPAIDASIVPGSSRITAICSIGVSIDVVVVKVPASTEGRVGPWCHRGPRVPFGRYGLIHSQTHNQGH